MRIKMKRSRMTRMTTRRTTRKRTMTISKLSRVLRFLNYKLKTI
jgi:hypothetical protein